MIESMLAALRVSFRSRPCARIRSLPVLVLLLACLSTLSAQTLTPGSPISFGALPVGTTSSGITFTFSTNAPTVVSAVSALTDGSSQQDFLLQNQNCVGTISPPQTCTVTVAFSPLQVGLRKGALVVYNGAGAIATQLYLSGLGTAPQIVLQPATAAAVTATPLVPAGFQTSTSVFDGAGDLFFNDITNGRILEKSASGTFSLYATVATTIHSELALSAAGLLYVTEPTLGEILVIPAGGTGVPAILPTGTNTLLEPTGIAVGNDGFVYVADAIQNRILRVAPDGSGSIAFTLSGLSTPLATPYGLAIGSLSGTPSTQALYIADSGNNRVVALNLSSGATTVYGGTVTAPLALAVDASSTVLVANGTGSLTLISPTGTNTTLTPLGGVLQTANGIALKPTGDLIVDDTTAGLVTVTRSASALNFPTTTLVGVFDSTDGYQVLGVQNSGNLPIALGGADPAFSSTAYAAGATSTCPVNSGQIAVAVACTYAIGFTPTLDGPNPATMTLSSAATTTSPAATATVNLTGTGQAHLTALTVTVAPAITTPGAPLGFTVTATEVPSTTPFLGTVTFTATDPTAKFLSGTTYTFTAADADTHTFTASAGIQFNTVGTYTVTATSATISGISNPVSVRYGAQATLASSVNPSFVGGPVTLTATVSITTGNASAAPSGTVTFFDGVTAIGTGTLTAINGTSATATLNTSFLSPGNHALTVAFPGDANYVPVTSPVYTQAVNNFTSQLTLTSSANPSPINGQVTITATVQAVSGTPNIAPNGLVTIETLSPYGYIPIGSGQLTSAPGNTGQFTLPVTFTTAGSQQLRAVYGSSASATNTCTSGACGGAKVAALYCFGTSIIYGTGATIPSFSPCALLGATVPGAAVHNYGAPGSAIPGDVAALFGAFVPSLTSPTATLFESGENDTYCPSPQPYCISNSANQYMAADAWAAIPPQYRIMAGATSSTGAWYYDPAFATNATASNSTTALASSTPSASRTFNIPASASPVVGLTYGVANGFAGTFTVSVDGQLVTDNCSGTTTFSSLPCNYRALYGSNYSFYRQEWPVTPGSPHTVIVTNTGNSEVVIVSVDWIPPASNVNTGIVLHAGVVPSFSSYVNFNPIAQSVANTLKADGLPVYYVDTINGTPGVNATTDISPTATNACPATQQLNHPNDCGNVHYFQTILNTEVAAGIGIGATAPAPDEFTAVNSNLLTQVVNMVTPTLTLTSSQLAVFLQTAITLTATVASPITGFNPTGMVTFLDGTTPLGTVNLINGVATLPVTFTTGVGPHALTFTYTGDGTFAPGTSPMVTEAVQDFSLAPSTTAGATVTVVGGNPATFTFALTPLGGPTFPGIVNLTVAGNPAKLQANLAPVSVLGGASASNPTLTIYTVSLIPHGQATPTQIAGIFREILPTAALLAIIPLAFLRRRRKLASITLTALLLTAALSLTGCITTASSGYADPANQPNQTYTITLTGNAGQLTHSTTVTLIITAE